MAPPAAPPVITLTTDVGLADSYVAAVKGVLFSLSPHAVLVDVTHLVPPQDILHGAYVLSTVHTRCPRGTCTSPWSIPASAHRAKASPSHSRAGITWGRTTGSFAGGALHNGQLPEDATAVEITNTAHSLPQVSATFHGRDVFAPAAAYFSMGGSLTDLGPPLAVLQTLGIQPPRVNKDGSIDGEVVHVDAYGNLVTNIPRDIAYTGTAEVRIGSSLIGTTRTTSLRETAAWPYGAARTCWRSPSGTAMRRGALA